MNREEAKELFRNDKDAYGKPKAVMAKIDRIYDEFEASTPSVPGKTAEEIFAGSKPLDESMQAVLNKTYEKSLKTTSRREMAGEIRELIQRFSYADGTGIKAGDAPQAILNLLESQNSLQTASLQQENERLREATTWISIHDRLPDNSRDVLATDEESDRVTIGWYEMNGWYTEKSMDVAYWMELPDASVKPNKALKQDKL